jgi:peptidoglycan/LPS O-acetylase OafA/YrhL
VRIRWPYLDLARGLAALVVALGHLRGLVFVDFADHLGIAWSLFYLLTGFGHQAVMIFFVLSGFLVGGQVVESMQTAQWSWTDYAITRMTRMWIVLLPAVLLTSFWDNLGMMVTGSPIYDGAMMATYNLGPSADPLRYSVASFLGNLVFLQNIAVPTFGSNSPLWSLANEFWYYLLFPLLFGSIVGKNPFGTRLRSAAIALMVCCWLPRGLVAYGLVWLFGVAVFYFNGKLILTSSCRNILLVLSGTLFGITLVLSRTNAAGEFSDFIIGATFATMLLPLGQMRQMRSVAVRRLSHVTAEFSYTLYVTHFPIAVFLACYVLSNRRLTPGLASAAIFIGMLVVVILYSCGIYFIFERNTRVVRSVILQFVVKYYRSGPRAA